MSATPVTKLTFALLRNSKSRLTLQAPQPVALEKGKRPTKRAIRMANALVLEHKLHSGALRSLTNHCDTFGITLLVLYKTLDMLDHTPEKIGTILRETY